MIHISEFNINFKNSIEETQSDKSKILATQEIVISCFNSSTVGTHRVDSVFEVMPEFMFIKRTKI